MSIRLLTLLLVSMLVLVACDTGDTASDSLSAQNQQPALVGYETTNLDVAADALLTTAGGASLTTGNVAMAAAVERLDTLLQCLQDTGSISGLMYMESSPGVIPQIGASFVVNQTRVERNIFSCVTDTPFSAQSVNVEPCIAYGEFTVQNDQFLFAYAGVGSGLCTGFETHFTNLNAVFTEKISVQ